MAASNTCNVSLSGFLKEKLYALSLPDASCLKLPVIERLNAYAGLVPS